MQKNKKKKRSITLIEMIVVMILIATISGAIAYNYKKSLNEGKAFKTREAISRVRNALELIVLEHPEQGPKIEGEWEKLIVESPLIANAKNFMNDGWGQKLHVTFNGTDVKVTSKKLKEYDGTTEE